MKKVIYIFILGVLISCQAFTENDSRPNVILILTDDQGWGDLSVNGNKDLSTPNIDQLAFDGVSFDRFYVSPVCSPTRAAIMTGKHPARINITDWIPGVDPKDKLLLGPKDLHALPLNEKTIAEFLKEGGYNTFYVGKWHLGSEGFYPENNGFDINIGGFEKGSPMGGYYSPYKNPKLSNGPEGEYLTDRLTNESIELIKNNNSSQPFALFLSYYNVHTPIQANKKYLEYFDNKLSQIEDNLVRTKKEGKAISRLNQTDSKYASMVYAVDQNIGKLIKNLKENKMQINEIVENRFKVKRALMRMKMRVAASMFNTWIDMVEERKRLRKIVSKTVKRMLNGKLNAGWKTWVKVTMQNRSAFEIKRLNKFPMTNSGKIKYSSLATNENRL